MCHLLPFQPLLYQVKCARKRSAARRRGCNVSRLLVLASTGPVIEGVVVAAALVMIAILIRDP